MLTEILPPGPEQIVAVGTALKAVVREQGMSDEDVERRQQIVSTMQELLLSVLPGIDAKLPDLCLHILHQCPEEVLCQNVGYINI